MVGKAASLRELNRALLARQHLLARTKEPVPAVLDHLVGMQAQEPLDPYVALFSRIEGFAPSDLGGLLERGDAVRLTLFRGTIHLVNTEDAYGLRPLVQAPIGRIAANFRKGFGGADPAAVERAARRLFAKGPLTYAELGKALAARFEGAHRESLVAMMYARIPLAQVPPRGVWGKGGPSKVLPLDQWAPRPKAKRESLDRLMLRYLAAFGPASARDATAWSGITHLEAVLEGLSSQLVRLSSPEGRVLYDLPQAPRPAGDTPAPPRFLPVYENLVLAYRDRERVHPPAKTVPLFRENELVRFVLIDGTFGARWKIEEGKADTRLTISPFVKVSKDDRAAVLDEAERLLTLWKGDDAKRRVVWKPK